MSILAENGGLGDKKVCEVMVGVGWCQMLYSGRRINPCICKAMKMRNSLLKAYKSTGSQSKLLKYKLYRNRIITELRKAKFKKIQTSDPKTFWRLIKVLARKTSSIPTFCASDSRLVHDDAVKANILNDQFSKNFNYSLTPVDLCTEYHFPDAKFPKEFRCTEELVLNLISSLDVKKEMQYQLRC